MGWKPKGKVAEVKEVEDDKKVGEGQEASLNPLTEDFFRDCMRLSAVESGARELANMRAGLSQVSAHASELPNLPQLAALGDKSKPVPHHRRDGLGRWMPSRVEGAGRL